MSTTVLPQLQEIEASLATQEEALTAQLEGLHQKLNSIRAVLPMFDGTSSAIEPAPSVSNKTAKPATIGSVPAKKPVSTKVKPSTTAKRQSSTSKKKKKDGRTASWQKYTRPGVKNESIPDAIKLILETQPNKDFKIAEVMGALFKEGMPKAQYLKARNRVSNVLSGGVRAGDWHRGERSTYRLSAD